MKYFTGQVINGKTVQKVEQLRSGYWVYFTDGSVTVYSY